MESKETRVNVDNAKYLTEYVNKRKAKKQKIELPDKYWNLSEWKSEYIGQLKEAHALLRFFSLEAIVSALNSKEFSWVYSLRTKGLIDIIKREQERINRRNLPKIEIPVNRTEDDVIVKVSKPVAKKTKFEGLDD